MPGRIIRYRQMRQSICPNKTSKTKSLNAHTNTQTRETVCEHPKDSVLRGACGYLESGHQVAPHCGSIAAFRCSCTSDVHCAAILALEPHCGTIWQPSAIGRASSFATSNSPRKPLARYFLYARVRTCKRSRYTRPPVCCKLAGDTSRRTGHDTDSDGCCHV